MYNSFSGLCCKKYEHGYCEYDVRNEGVSVDRIRSLWVSEGDWHGKILYGHFPKEHHCTLLTMEEGAGRRVDAWMTKLAGLAIASRASIRVSRYDPRALFHSIRTNGPYC